MWWVTRSGIKIDRPIVSGWFRDEFLKEHAGRFHKKIIHRNGTFEKGCSITSAVVEYIN